MSQPCGCDEWDENGRAIHHCPECAHGSVTCGACGRVHSVRVTAPEPVPAAVPLEEKLAEAKGDRDRFAVDASDASRRLGVIEHERDSLLSSLESLEQDATSLSEERDRLATQLAEATRLHAVETGELREKIQLVERINSELADRPSKESYAEMRSHVVSMTAKLRAAEARDGEAVESLDAALLLLQEWYDYAARGDSWDRGPAGTDASRASKTLAFVYNARKFLVSRPTAPEAMAILSLAVAAVPADPGYHAPDCPGWRCRAMKLLGIPSWIGHPALQPMTPGAPDTSRLWEPSETTKEPAK